MAMSLPAFRCSSRGYSFSRKLISKHRLLSTNIKNNVEINNFNVETVQYPPIKPKFPPGKWGDMEHEYAWLWQKAKEEITDIPDVQGRLDHMNSMEMSCINAIPYNDHPDYLHFAKFITKTHLFKWNENKPVVYSDIRATVEALDLEVIDRIKQTLIEQIELENELILRDSPLNKEKEFSKLIIRCIVDTLTTHLSGVCDHLRLSMYDEDVIVRTLWDRHGIKRLRRVRTGADGHLIYKPVQDQRIISSSVFDGMLRSDICLPEVCTD